MRITRKMVLGWVAVGLWAVLFGITLGVAIADALTLFAKHVWWMVYPWVLGW